MNAALKEIGATEIETDCANTTCTFQVSTETDIKAKLDEIATDGNKLSGWALVD